MAEIHFMRADLLATALAVFLFGLIAIIPGYVFGWMSGLLAFRSQSVSWRFVISVPVSIAICPILAYWIDDIAGRTFVWAALLMSSGLFVLFLLRELRKWRLHWPSMTSIGFISIAMLWAVLVICSVLDFQLGNRLYGTVSISDQSFRTAVTDTITRTGIAHPRNPLYYADGPAALQYHYFWFILCSLVDELGGAAVPARQAFVASIVWCGIALGCVIALYVKFFSPGRAASIHSRILRGLMLLAVTGLDIIPTLSLARQHVVYMDMEWWNEAVTSWFGSLLWAPHHVGGLISGLIAFLMLWHAATAVQGTEKWILAAVAGIALASMIGTSIYVGLVFVAFLTLWTVITFLRGWRNHTAVLVVAGIVTIILAAPYLKNLASPTGQGTFIHFTVRDFKGARAFFLTTEFNELWKTYLARLVLLPLNYFVELSFFLVVGVLQIARLWSRRPLKPGAVAAITMLLTSVAICTFLKSGFVSSGYVSNNDLGWRGFLPAQFILLLWAIDYLPAPEQPGSKLHRYLSPWLPLLLIIGVVSTAYSATVLRTAEILNDPGPEHASGKRMYAVRRVYERLQTILPVAAVVQQNPDPENPVYWGLYADRQTAVGNSECGSWLGGSAQACKQAYPAVSSIFSARGADPEEVTAVCHRLHIDALVVTSADPVWASRESWVWKMQPVISTDSARGFLISPI